MVVFIVELVGVSSTQKAQTQREAYASLFLFLIKKLTERFVFSPFSKRYRDLYCFDYRQGAQRSIWSLPAFQAQS